MKMSGKWRPWPLLFPLAGFLALLWFVVRVAPRPSRAMYPCQRLAAPAAGGFLVWLGGAIGSLLAFRQGKVFRRRSRLVMAALCLATAAVVGATTLIIQLDGPVWADPHVPNDPIGTAVGVNPGRVVWVHDPDATDWEGPGHGYWWESSHTIQAAVDEMMSSAVLALAGQSSEAAAWDALFRDFNLRASKGDVGYLAGEKIVIKVNFVGCHYYWGGCDPVTYDLTAMDYMNTSPQMILALLRQLVQVVGVAEQDISVGDPQCLFPNQYHDVCHVEFPDVHYLDHNGGNPEHPRTAVQNSTVPVHWSSHPTGVLPDVVPQCFAETEYLVNLANFKSHMGAGVTLGAKNHFGTLLRYPVQEGYFDLHEDLAFITPDEGSYRNLVDLMGHAHLGGKTFLYLIDGLYAGVHPDDTAPRRWEAPPFNGDWTSSLFASQDPIAIESVCFDLMQEEGDPRNYPHIAGADDYLLEGALANAPPSGTYYDPDHAGDVERLGSLGVHEHWNNPIDRQYTRNLGTGDGIELIRISLPTGIPDLAQPGELVLRSFPNPFNPRTTISFELPAAGPVSLAIFGLDGKLIRTLVTEDLAAGPHRVSWDGRDDRGRPVASGAFCCLLRAGSLHQSQRLVLVR